MQLVTCLDLCITDARYVMAESGAVAFRSLALGARRRVQMSLDAHPDAATDAPVSCRDLDALRGEERPTGLWTSKPHAPADPPS